MYGWKPHPQNDEVLQLDCVCVLSCSPPSDRERDPWQPFIKAGMVHNWLYRVLSCDVSQRCM